MTLNPSMHTPEVERREVHIGDIVRLAAVDDPRGAEEAIEATKPVRHDEEEDEQAGDTKDAAGRGAGKNVDKILEHFEVFERFEKLRDPQNLERFQHSPGLQELEAAHVAVGLLTSR